MDTLSIYYIVALWFFVIAVFNKKHRPLAAILSFISISNIVIIDVFNLSDYLSQVEMKAFLVVFDSLSAFVMAELFKVDKTAYKQAVILIFAVTCHIMVLLLFINASYEEDGSYIVWLVLTYFYVNHYNNLIILSAILQMAVSYNGLRGALINAYRAKQSFVVWHIRNSGRVGESPPLQERKKGNSRT